MISKLFSCCTLLLIVQFALAQGTRYGLKIGPSIGLQRWNYFQNDPLFQYHGALSMESFSEEDPFSFFGQLGYHVKGSATRYSTPIQFGSQLFEIPTDKFLFRNASLVLGVKKKYPKERNTFYYGVGIRGDYTISTNLKNYEQINQFFPIYPFETGVKKFMGGITFNGGMEFAFNEYVGGILEMSINPDVTKQYFQLPINNIIDPYNPGQKISVSEKSIKNLTIEISLGIYLTRKVVYID